METQTNNTPIEAAAPPSSHTAPPKKKHSILRAVLYALCGLLLTVGVVAFALGYWYMTTFDLEFKDLLYTLASPLQGTGNETVKEVLSVILPAAILTAVLYVGAVLLIELVVRRRSPRAVKWLTRAGAALCACTVVASAVFAVYALRLPTYIELSTSETSFYETYYVHPDDVAITAEGETKNLIYIYLESMETTYASTEEGGKQAKNYMPLLTHLAADNLSFSDKENGILGGFHTPQGTGWTIAALMATSAGIPFSFPLGENGNNSMSKEKIFASGLVTLGDILEEKGYNQEFLCGSNVAFGGRDKYYEQHGDYEIYDLYTARREGVVEEDYHNGFWGIEDSILFEIAKGELTELAAEDEPFNFTMLTVDAHHNGGYICDLCGDDYPELSDRYAQTANVITCQDKQVVAFVDWCRQQAWFEDTVIVITGDHPRMDVRLVSGIDYDERTVYNCFINAAVEPDHAATEGRVWTSFDMFPTTLAAMGFTIEGERLALGTNMFSYEPTLAESLGYDYLETEIQKFSAFYINEFCPELADRVTEIETEAESPTESENQGTQP